MENEDDENKGSSIIDFIHFQYRCWPKFLMLEMTLWRVKTSWYVRVWRFNSSIDPTIDCRFDTCINIMYVNQMQTISPHCAQITFTNICDVEIPAVPYHNSTKQRYIIQTCLVVVDDFDKNPSTSYVDNHSKRKLPLRLRFVARVTLDFNIEEKKKHARVVVVHCIENLALRFKVDAIVVFLELRSWRGKRKNIVRLSLGHNICRCGLRKEIGE